MAKAQLFAALLVLGLIACTSASPALMEQVKELNEQGLERRDVASGACITTLYVMGFSSNDLNANAAESAHMIEMKVNGVVRKGRLPNLPGDDFQRAKGDLWKISVASFGFTDTCIRKSEIEQITLEQGSNDGWHIDSIVTFVGTANGQTELATMDINTFQWIDGDGATDARRFVLTLLLN